MAAETGGVNAAPPNPTLAALAATASEMLAKEPQQVLFGMNPTDVRNAVVRSDSSTCPSDFGGASTERDACEKGLQHSKSTNQSADIWSTIDKQVSTDADINEHRKSSMVRNDQKENHNHVCEKPTPIANEIVEATHKNAMDVDHNTPSSRTEKGTPNQKNDSQNRPAASMSDVGAAETLLAFFGSSTTHQQVPALTEADIQEQDNMHRMFPRRSTTIVAKQEQETDGTNPVVESASKKPPAKLKRVRPASDKSNNGRNKRRNVNSGTRQSSVSTVLGTEVQKHQAPIVNNNNNRGPESNSIRRNKGLSKASKLSDSSNDRSPQVSRKPKNRRALNLLEKEALAMQPGLHSKITETFADFRTILERTMKVENLAYDSKQYSELDIRHTLADSMKDAIAALQENLTTNAPIVTTASLLGNPPVKGRGKQKRFDLFTSCIEGNVDQVKQFVEQDNSINQRNESSFTPLFLAVRNERYEVAKYLLEVGADPSQCCGNYGTPPLHDAVLKHNPEMVKLLIEYGADRNQKSTRGQDVFDYDMNMKMWSALRNTPSRRQNQIQSISGKSHSGSKKHHAEGAADSGVFEGQMSKAKSVKANVKKMAKRSSQTPEGLVAPKEAKVPKKKLPKETKLRALFLDHPYPWGPCIFESDTCFFLGKDANDALMLSGRGRLWGKHKELFRHSCSRQEKQYLVDNGNAISKGVGLKATLVLASQIWKLTTLHPHYSSNQEVQHNVSELTAFTLNEEILVSLRSKYNINGLPRTPSHAAKGKLSPSSMSLSTSPAPEPSSVSASASLAPPSPTHHGSSSPQTVAEINPQSDAQSTVMTQKTVETAAVNSMIVVKTT